MATSAPQLHPWESSSTPGLSITCLKTRSYAESRRPNKATNFARGVGGLAPSGHPEGRDFWPRGRSGCPHRTYEEASPKLSRPCPSLGLHSRVSRPAPKGGGSRAAAAAGNLGPSGAGRARPTRASSLVAAPTRSDSARRAPRGTRARGLPGLAQRLSPWKRWVDSAVNINFPSSRQPRRRVSTPRPRSRLRGPPSPVLSPAPRSLGSSGQPPILTTPPGAATVSTTTRPLACQPGGSSGVRPGRVRKSQSAGAVGP